MDEEMARRGLGSGRTGWTEEDGGGFHSQTRDNGTSLEQQVISK